MSANDSTPQKPRAPQAPRSMDQARTVISPGGPRPTDLDDTKTILTPGGQNSADLDDTATMLSPGTGRGGDLDGAETMLAPGRGLDGAATRLTPGKKPGLDDTETRLAPGGADQQTVTVAVRAFSGARPGMPLPPGDRFEILEELGAGGMGVVYRARDRKLSREVALKSLLPGSIADKKILARFWREAKAIASLNHFNIVGIHNVLEAKNGIWIEMEYVPGGSLTDLVGREGPLEATAARKMGLALCDALAHAHSKGILHRDIKPGNILLTEDGLPKLGDFGLAQDKENQEAMTLPGTMMGTLHFAAPEQLSDAGSVDARSDIYGLGATLYAALTGEPPRAIRLERIPESLRAVVGKSLEGDPDKRFASALEMKEALEKSAPARGAARTLSCGECGFENPTGVRFCQKCGKGLFSQVEKCVKCGWENEQGAEFCGKCGDNMALFRSIMKAREAFKKGEMAQAERLYQAAQDLDEKNDEAKARLRLIRENKNRIRQLWAQAERAAEMNDKESAARAYKDILDLDPSHQEARKRMDAAREWLVDVRVRRARTFFATKKDDKALEQILVVLDVAPENEEANHIFEQLTRRYKPAAQAKREREGGEVVPMNLSSGKVNRKVFQVTVPTGRMMMPGIGMQVDGEKAQKDDY
ncbi:MAG: protein kinase, partial [Proteobacteria bacterium]|nr:protein kinase [Pseudomonadota bacterium]